MDHEQTENTAGILPPNRTLEEIAAAEIESREEAGEIVFSDCVAFIEYYTSHIDEDAKDLTDALTKAFLGQDATEEEEFVGYNAYIYAIAIAKSLIGDRKVRSLNFIQAVTDAIDDIGTCKDDAMDFMLDNDTVRERLILPMVAALESESETRPVAAPIMSLTFMWLEQKIIAKHYLDQELERIQHELGWDE